MCAPAWLAAQSRLRTSATVPGTWADSAPTDPAARRRMPPLQAPSAGFGRTGCPLLGADPRRGARRDPRRDLPGLSDAARAARDSGREGARPPTVEARAAF